MWAAAMEPAAAPPVAWDALWASEPSPIHHDVFAFGLDSLLRRRGELKDGPSVFARPDEAYWQVVAEARREREEVAERRAEAARRAAARRAKAAAAKASSSA